MRVPADGGLLAEAFSRDIGRHRSIQGVPKGIPELYLQLPGDPPKLVDGRIGIPVLNAAQIGDTDLALQGQTFLRIASLLSQAHDGISNFVMDRHEKIPFDKIIGIVFFRHQTI